MGVTTSKTSESADLYQHPAAIMRPASPATEHPTITAAHITPTTSFKRALQARADPGLGTGAWESRMGGAPLGSWAEPR